MSSDADEVIELMAALGQPMDPWQQLALRDSLGIRADGKFSAFEVGVVVSRQNGKGAILEAREIGGLFLFGERLQLHSAHEFKTAREAFIRVRDLIDRSDDLRKRVKRVWTGVGSEGIELLNGARLRFVARSKGSGRGFSGDLLVYDEAMILTPEAVAASLPALSARPNPQVWYTGSAGFASSTVLHRLRKRAIAGGDESLAYNEWSVDPEDFDPDRDEDIARANPALGQRITLEHVHNERRAMDDESFFRERLGIWDDEQLVGTAIPFDWWEAASSPTARLDDDAQVVFAVDMSPDRGRSAIAVAGPSRDKVFAEIVEHKAGTGWIGSRLVELNEKWRPVGFVIDDRGPAAALIPELEELDVPIIVAKTRDVTDGCGQFYDLLAEGHFRHTGGYDPLTTAVANAAKRQVGDAWAWKRTEADSSPLVAVTLAVWGFLTQTSTAEPSIYFV